QVVVAMDERLDIVLRPEASKRHRSDDVLLGGNLPVGAAADAGMAAPVTGVQFEAEPVHRIESWQAPMKKGRGHAAPGTGGKVKNVRLVTNLDAANRAGAPSARRIISPAAAWELLPGKPRHVGTGYLRPQASQRA